MRAEIRTIYSTDIDLNAPDSTPVPETYHLGFQVGQVAPSGPTGVTGTEHFDLYVCTLDAVERWLRERGGILELSDYLVVDDVKPADVVAHLHRRVGELEGESWDEISHEIRLFAWATDG